MDNPKEILQNVARQAITETRGSAESNYAISVPLKFADWLDMKIEDYQMFEELCKPGEFEFHMSFDGIDTVTRVSEALAALKNIVTRVEDGGNLTARDAPALEKANLAFNFVIHIAEGASKDTRENRNAIDELISFSIDDPSGDALKNAIDKELALRQKTVEQLKEIQSNIKKSADILRHLRGEDQKRSPN